MSKRFLGFIAVLCFILTGFFLRGVGEGLIWAQIVLLPSFVIGSICIGKLVKPEEI